MRRWFEEPGGVVLLYNSKLKERARFLRKNSTVSEVLLWNKLKNKQFYGLDFHRQKPIGNYIVDFYCPELKLIIEIDGNSHDENKFEYDKRRIDYLKSLNLKVIIFSDQELKRNVDSIIQTLENYYNETHP
ncbi:MAG: endonuclease domain-containing protein [Candidatus Dojkabacteria bacterium]